MFHMSNNSKLQVLIAIRIPVELKNKLIGFLPAVGLNLSSYFRLAAQQLVIQDKIPFDFVASNQSNTTNKVRKQKVMVSFKMPLSVKEQMTDLLLTMGLTLTSYFILAAEQLIAQKKIPFEIRTV